MCVFISWTFIKTWQRGILIYIIPLNLILRGSSFTFSFWNSPQLSLLNIWRREKYSSEVTLKSHPPLLFEHNCCLSFLVFQVDPLFQDPCSLRWIFVFSFSAHPNTNGRVHPIFCSFIHFMNLKVGSIDWLIEHLLAFMIDCILIYWLIDFAFAAALIDFALIDWLNWNWHLLIDLNWHLVTFVHLRLPSAQFTHFGSSQLIDWLIVVGGCSAVAPNYHPAKIAKINSL